MNSPLLTERSHIRGLYWDEGRPALQVAAAPTSNKERRVEVAEGAELAFVLDGLRTCVGVWDATDQRRRRCPDGAVVPWGNQSQCLRCESAGGSFYARTGLATATDRGAELLRRDPHIAYLALFGRHLVKVGVAAESRKLNRVLEQGAAASVFFAKGDGDDVRRVEADVARDHGLTTHVAMKKKLLLVWDPPDEGTAQAVLMKHLTDLRENSSVEDSTCLSDAAIVQYHLPRYGEILSHPDFTRIDLIEKVAAGDSLAGRVRAILGSLIIFEVEDRMYALDSRTLAGFSVEPIRGADKHVTATSAPMVRPQDSLF